MTLLGRPTMRVEERSEPERLRGLDGAKPGAIRRVDDLFAIVHHLDRVRGSDAWDRRTVRATGGDRPLEELRARERAGGVVDEHEVGGPVGEGLQTATDRFLARPATGNGRQELAGRRLETRNGVLEPRPIVRVDDWQDAVDERRREELLQRMNDDRFACQSSVLLRNLAADPRASAGGDDDGGNRH